MKQYNYIYKITNLANGKIYIGKHSTDNLNDSYMGSGKIIKNAIAKYGKNAFKKDIIAFTDNEDSLNFLERFYIKKYKSQDSSIGYNLTDGGEGTTGFHPSETSRRKMSIAAKGKHLSYETKCKISEANKGKHCTEETRAKMSAKAKGNKYMLGRHHSDEARKKMSKTRKGKPAWNKGVTITDEQKKKISDAHKGKKLSEETCKKMSISKKLRNQNPPKWITPEGDIKIMNKATAKRWHPDWKLIEK